MGGGGGGGGESGSGGGVGMRASFFWIKSRVAVLGLLGGRYGYILCLLRALKISSILFFFFFKLSIIL